MSSKCGWCSSNDRASWEARIADGEPVAAVASETPFSVRAAYRHLGHAYDRSAGVAIGLQASDFVARLVGLADQAAADGMEARAVGNGRTALEALRTEAKIVSTVLDRFGIDSEQTLTLMREGQLLATGLGRLIAAGQVSDDVLEGLVDHLDALGASELSQAIDSMRFKSRTQAGVGVRREGEAALAASTTSMRAQTQVSQQSQSIEAVS